jgi:hypothetical protein
VLLTIRVGNSEINEPLLLVEESQGARAMACMGYGLYRWKLLANGPARARGIEPPSIFTNFVQQSVSWLKASKEKRVRIRPLRPTFVTTEQAVLQATVRNSLGEFVSDAVVKAVVQSASVSGQQYPVTFQHLGNGVYSSTIGTLPAGNYTFAGNATVGSSVLGTDEGGFRVSTVSEEYRILTQNAALLKSLAQSTNARYGTARTIDAVLDALVSDPRMQPIAVQSTSEFYLWHSAWLLGVAIALFAAEWLLRRRLRLL